MKEETKGRIIMAVVPKTFLLGTKLGDWYRKNPYHRFNKGDILILKARNIVGFGFRPVAIVNGYEIKNFGIGPEGKYDITMHQDTKYLPEYDGRGLVKNDRWWEHNEVPKGVERTVNEHEFHFKWNLEYLFKKVPVKTVEEALALYASREVLQEGIAA